MNNEEKQKASLDTWVSFFNTCIQKNKETRLSSHDVAKEADKFYKETLTRFPFLLSLDEVKNGSS